VVLLNRDVPEGVREVEGEHVVVLAQHVLQVFETLVPARHLYALAVDVGKVDD